MRAFTSCLLSREVDEALAKQLMVPSKRSLALQRSWLDVETDYLVDDHAYTPATSGSNILVIDGSNEPIVLEDANPRPASPGLPAGPP